MNSDDRPDTPSEDMSLIERRLGIVRRRLHANRLLSVMFFDLTVGLIVFACFCLVHQLIATPLDPFEIFLGVMGLSLFVSLVRGGLFGRSSLFFKTAVLVDDNLRLKERVSSAVYMQNHAELRAAELVEWKELIERDCADSINGANVQRAFPIRLPRVALVALGVLVLTILIPVVIPQQDLFDWQKTRVADAAMKKELSKEVEKLRQSSEFEELEKMAEESDDPELQKILEALKKMQDPEKQNQPGIEDPDKQDGDEAKKQTLVKMSRLEDLIKKKTQKGDFEELKDLLDKLKTTRIKPDDLTKKLQEALKDADLAKAQEELKKLMDKLKKLQKKQESGQLTDEELARMQKLQRELMALSRMAGGSFSKLSSGLQGLSSPNLSPEDLAQLLKNMEDLSLDLESLKQLMQQMQTLDQSLQMLKLAKQGMGKFHKCPNCGKLSNKPGGT